MHIIHTKLNSANSTISQGLSICCKHLNPPPQSSSKGNKRICSWLCESSQWPPRAAHCILSTYTSVMGSTISITFVGRGMSCSLICFLSNPGPTDIGCITIVWVFSNCHTCLYPFNDSGSLLLVDYVHHIKHIIFLGWFCVWHDSSPLYTGCVEAVTSSSTRCHFPSHKCHTLNCL